MREMAGLYGMDKVSIIQFNFQYLTIAIYRRTLCVTVCHVSEDVKDIC